MKRAAKHNLVRRRGLSIAEACIALAIAASLLTAIGSAFVSSSKIIRHNDQVVRAVQGARLAVNRLTYELRTAQSADIDEESIELITGKGETRTYNYNGATRELTVTLPNAGTPVTHVIARNIADVDFRTDTVTVTVRMTATVGTDSITLSGSATPRRNVLFE
jgi:hypothetical protein